MTKRHPDSEVAAVVRRLMLAQPGPVTDEDLYDRLTVSVDIPMVSADRLLHGRKRLADLGMIREAGRKKTRSGSSARLWELVN